MVIMSGREKGYDRLGEAGNIDIWGFLKRRDAESEKRNRAKFEKEDPEMYHEFLEWEKQWEKYLAEDEKEKEI